MMQMNGAKIAFVALAALIVPLLADTAQAVVMWCPSGDIVVLNVQESNQPSHIHAVVGHQCLRPYGEIGN